jgi:hypothetical protein
MDSNYIFEEQPNTARRHWKVIVNKAEVGFIWFKHTLGGWNAMKKGDTIRYHIDSVTKLNQLFINAH